MALFLKRSNHLKINNPSNSIRIVNNNINIKPTKYERIKKKTKEILLTSTVHGIPNIIRSENILMKITKDEKQFANKKLYNFEGDGRQNINPHNPFASSYGMEPYSQEVRNANLVNNTLEFSSILYSDDPLMRIKQKHKKNIIS